MTTSQADATRLQLLLGEYAEARDDDRYYFTQFTTLVTLALSLIVVMAGVYSQTCAQGSSECADKTLTKIPVWVYIGGPILPTALLSYSVVLSTVNTLRSYYLRTLEVQLHDLTGQRQEGLPVPSWSHITLEVSGQSSASPLPRLNWYLMYSIAILIVVVWGHVIFFKIPDVRHRIFALLFNGLLLTVPAALAGIDVTKGSRLWKRSLSALPKRLERTAANFSTPTAKRRERTLTSFLLLPRNQEEFIKALFVPGCFLIGLAIAPTPSVATWADFWARLPYLAGFYITFEFIIYQARYLWNDVRDRRIDSSRSLSKMRFPSSLVEDQVALKAAALSFVIRCAVGLLLVACVFPIDNYRWLWHVMLLSLIFVIAWMYEQIRHKCKSAGDLTRNRWTWGLVGTAGLGYGLRSFVGLWLAGLADPRALILATSGAALFGSTFVSLTWALESTRPGIGNRGGGKAHLALFRAAVSRTLPKTVDIGPSVHVLVGRQSPRAPWCVSAVLATVVLAQFALDFVGESAGDRSVAICPYGHCADIDVLSVVEVATVAVAALAVVVPIRMAWLLFVMDGVGVGCVLFLLSLPIAQSAIATGLVVLPVGVTCVFRGMRFDDLPGLWGQMSQRVLVAVRGAYLWFIRER